jgi:hypothetical protein
MVSVIKGIRYQVSLTISSISLANLSEIAECDLIVMPTGLTALDARETIRRMWKAGLIKSTTTVWTLSNSLEAIATLSQYIASSNILAGPTQWQAHITASGEISVDPLPKWKLWHLAKETPCDGINSIMNELKAFKYGGSHYLPVNHDQGAMRDFVSRYAEQKFPEELVTDKLAWQDEWGSMPEVLDGAWPKARQVALKNSIPVVIWSADGFFAAFTFKLALFAFSRGFCTIRTFGFLFPDSSCEAQDLEIAAGEQNRLISLFRLSHDDHGYIFDLNGSRTPLRRRFELFDEFLASKDMSVWGDPTRSFVCWRDVPGLRLIQRCQLAGNCYLHAPITILYYLQSRYVADVGVVDLGAYLRRSDNEMLQNHVFHGEGGRSDEILKQICQPGTITRWCSCSEITESLMKQYGPILIAKFQPYQELTDRDRRVYVGQASGQPMLSPSGPTHSSVPRPSLRAMVIIGVRTEQNQRRFLVQNWWAKQFFEVDEAYLVSCGATTLYVATAQDQVSSDIPVLKGSWFECFDLELCEMSGLECASMNEMTLKFIG